MKEGKGIREEQGTAVRVTLQIFASLRKCVCADVGRGEGVYMSVGVGVGGCETYVR